MKRKGLKVVSILLAVVALLPVFALAACTDEEEPPTTDITDNDDSNTISETDNVLLSIVGTWEYRYRGTHSTNEGKRNKFEKKGEAVFCTMFFDEDWSDKNMRVVCLKGKQPENKEAYYYRIQILGHTSYALDDDYPGMLICMSHDRYSKPPAAWFEKIA